MSAGILNSWGKNNNDSALTGIFPEAFVVAGKLTDNTSTISAADDDPYGGSGVFIPFKNLTGILDTTSSEIGFGPVDKANKDDWTAGGGSKFMLAVMESAFAAQQNAATADRLANCVVTRSALSVVDEDTLQKTFTVKFKLNHSSQEIENEPGWTPPPEVM